MVFKRLTLLLLFAVPALAHADLNWAATTVFTAAAPSEGRADATFTFTNTGTYPIKITNTRTSCGCTAAVADSRAIPPGGTGKINVTFKTLNRRGLYEEPIEIDTNDPKASLNTIILRVLIRDAVEILPTLLFWQPGEPLTAKVIKISVTEGFTVDKLDITSSNPDVQTNLETVKAGSDYKLIVTPKSQHQKATISITPAVQGRSPHALAAHVRVS